MSDYVEGEVYFCIKWPGRFCLIPMIDSYVYVGKNLSDEDEQETWYFQWAEDYAKYGSIRDASEGSRQVTCLLESELVDILDADGLLRELEKAVSRRQNQKDKNKNAF